VAVLKFSVDDVVQNYIFYWTAKYMVSCEEAKMLNPLLPNLEMYVDIDDSGPLDPFPVNCVFLGICFTVYILVI